MRKDVQCLRGIAISLVILYHLYPTVFINGFLGVDIFFVISGYLMGRTLTHKNIESYQDILKFYYRRFKRILPLYYLILILSILAVQTLLGDFWWSTNHRYFKSALLLSTNIRLIIDGNDYFNEFQTDSSAMNLFMHTWSLGVEMQFYLIVPFIFLALQCLRNDHHKFIVAIIMSSMGFVAFLFAPSVSAFNFMHFRLWQFAAGFIALFWILTHNQEHLDYEKVNLEDNETHVLIDNENSKKLETSISLTPLLFLGILCLPFEIEARILRPLVTLASVFLIANGSENQENLFLISNLLAYIGDISYSLYLVHWPIITIANSFYLEFQIVPVAATFLTAIFLHECFEKQYLKLEWKAMIPLLLILIAGSVGLQKSLQNDNLWRTTYPAAVQKVVDQNRPSLKHLWRNDPDTEECAGPVIAEDIDKTQLPIMKDCRYTGNGTLSIMIIGNSYSMNFAKYFRAHFHRNYSDWRILSLLDSDGIYGDTKWSYSDLELSKRHVELYKPDVLVVMARYSATLRTPIQHPDGLVSQMNENLAFYQKFVKRIYLMNAHPLYHLNFLSNFLNNVVRNRGDLERLHLNKKAADAFMKNAADRLRRLDCEMCRIFSLAQVFEEDDKYLTFDRKTMMTYVDNSYHFTMSGVKLCDPVFESLAKEIMSIV